MPVAVPRGLTRPDEPHGQARLRCRSRRRRLPLPTLAELGHGRRSRRGTRPQGDNPGGRGAQHPEPARGGFMTKVIYSWRCLECHEHGTGTQAEVQKAAEKHTAKSPKHGTVVEG